MKKSISKPKPGVRKVYDNRFLLTYEPERMALWREAAARHNVSVATWIRWACDLAVARKDGPTGEVTADGVQR